MDGDQDPLKNVIFKHTGTQYHDEIAEHLNSDHTAPTMSSKLLTLNIDRGIAKKLKVMATLRHESSHKYAADIIASFVDDRYEERFEDRALRRSTKSQDSTEYLVHESRLSSNCSGNSWGTMRYRKPISFTFLDTSVPVWRWDKLLVKVCKIIFEANRDNFVETVLQLKGRKHKYFAYDKSELDHYQGKNIPGTDIYVGTKLNRMEIIKRCCRIMECFGYDQKELEIKTVPSAPLSLSSPSSENTSSCPHNTPLERSD
jgi:hypothetical protein